VALKVVSRLSGFPLYPLALASAFLINELIESWTPTEGLLRPVLAVSAAVLVIQLIGGPFMGRERAGALAAVVVLGAFDFKIPIYLVLIAVVLLLWSLIRNRVVAPLDWRALTRVLNFIGVTALVITIAQGLLIGLSLPPAGFMHAAGERPRTAGPDVYLLLLDAYPRSDTLQEALGYDNTAFLDAMSDLGFDIAQDAHSNYNRTLFTLASMLNARHVDELMPNPPPGHIPQYRHLASLVRSGTALADARSLGYEVVVLPSGVAAFTPSSADRVVDSGHLTQYEHLLPRNGALRYLLRDPQLAWFRGDHRDRVLWTFDQLGAMPLEHAARPRLVLAHVMVPHTPVVFRSDGSLANVPECFWDNCRFDRPLSEEFRAGIVEQISFTNARVKATVAEIIGQSQRPPVVIVFSDHGFRHWSSDKAETFRSLFLSYTPGHRRLFPETSTPINIIPRILNAYFDESLPLADEDVWYALGNTDGFFPLRRYSEEPVP
jgi:hypothetical protein